MNTPLFWSFSLHALQAGLWTLGLALSVWAGLRLRWSRLVALLVFLTMDLVMFGAYVRLADAGLGCPDWPGCYAQFTPAQAGAEIRQAVATQGGGEQGSVNPFKAWVEMLHRYVATVIGSLILAMNLRALLARSRRRRGAGSAAVWRHRLLDDHPVRLGLPLLLLGWVVLQGLFGAWTVTLLLKPLIVTGHLMGGVILLLLAAWFWMPQRPERLRQRVDGATRLLLALGLLATLVQVFLGGWVSTNYAALACSGFPSCNGSWTPAVDWSGGYALWRDLGRNPDGSLLGLPALVAIQWGHRLFAAALTLLLLGCAWRMQRWSALRGPGRAVAALLLLQLALGASLVWLQHPLLPAVAHNGVAALLLLLLTIAVWRSAPASSEACD